MTQLIYFTDPYIPECKSTVLDIVEQNNAYATVLDKTCFFPEGGGQQSDVGTIGDTPISDAQTLDGTVYHYSEKKPEYNIGDTVLCRIDFGRRFARMQSHSGEHIVSGIVYSKYGFDNVGFHMDDTLMTVDFSGYLTKDQLHEIELEANRAVWQNRKITAYFPTDEEIQNLTYRSKLDNLKNTRIVEIDGIDRCACCAPHVANTGEIGIIKILSSMSHRGGVRITLVCGSTAQSMLSAMYDDMLKTAALLKSPHDGIPQATSELLDRINLLKREIALQTQNRIDDIVSSARPTDGNICVFANGFSGDDLRRISVSLREKCTCLSCALSGDDKNGYTYVITSNSVRLKSLSKEINTALNGRGGGSDDILQGRFSASKQQITEYFENGANTQNENA